ncbi:MAG: UDP-N-acetylglucosamine 2-epimerase (hydrolyzing) [Candidatus Niyogibacteria bacterium]|nr:MAG: UDP-N-acetylglucosamine 2-epimerase (hydrolyzing) [Candidatus Niyogibacteria bacterium]
MAKKKVLIITGSRADYGLLKPVIFYLRKSRKLEPKILATGMHALNKLGNTLKEVKKDFPNVAVVGISEKDDMLRGLSKEIEGIRKYCLKNSPDGIFVLGDRDEMLAGAIVGAHLNIPVFHLRGGELTGYVVDEHIRHAITKFSSLHFVTTKNHRKRVLQLGEEPNRVFVTGATEFDRLWDMKFLSRRGLKDKFGPDPEKRWFVVLQHPTPLDIVSFKDQIKPLLRVVSGIEAEKIVIYPNSDTGGQILINEINKYRKRGDFYVFANLSREDYLSFLKQSDLLIGNSSSGIVDSGYFKIPSIQVGTREKGRERGKNVIECGYDEKSIKRAIAKALSPIFKAVCRKSVSPYGSGGAAKKIVRILEKHIDRKDLLLKSFVTLDIMV